MHLVVVLLFLATLQLGWWQWQRAEIRGWNAQNVSYAFQWPVYGLMGLWFYSRFMRIEVERDPDAGEPHKAVALYQAPRIDTTGDPELAAYNSYLAELNEKVLRQRRS
ncbi:metalloprotease [Blastococcus sp. KM273128]|uniref:metalloprotease n=1 Tax=Blastococcus sp. KM273128 TaxID=2570314 RepID=UPI001F39FB10|nr:metalloprotease [Blastococcus sp. KM273128]